MLINWFGSEPTPSPKTALEKAWTRKIGAACHNAKQCGTSRQNSSKRSHALGPPRAVRAGPAAGGSEYPPHPRRRAQAVEFPRRLAGQQGAEPRCAGRCPQRPRVLRRTAGSRSGASAGAFAGGARGPATSSKAERGIVEPCHELGQVRIVAARIGDRPGAPGGLAALEDEPGMRPPVRLPPRNTLWSLSEACRTLMLPGGLRTGRFASLSMWAVLAGRGKAARLRPEWMHAAAPCPSIEAPVVGGGRGGDCSMRRLTPDRLYND